MVDELSDFLDFARDRLMNSDDPVPCAPEDCAAVLGFLVALVPEYQLARQAEATDGEARRADRRQAVLNGFRRARGAASNGSTNGNGGRPRPAPAPAAADDDDAGAGEAA